MMSPDIAEAAAVVATTLGLGIILLRVARTEGFIRRSIENTSRFGVFAARDKLVRLVIDGKVQESNRAWQDVYGSINDFLGLERRRDLFRFVNSMIRVMVKQAVNKQARESFQAYNAELNRACDEYPEFGAAVSESNHALFDMMYRRTSIPLFKCYLFLLKTYGMLCALALHGLRGVLVFGEAVFTGDRRIDPSPYMAYRHRYGG